MTMMVSDTTQPGPAALVVRIRWRKLPQPIQDFTPPARGSIPGLDVTVRDGAASWAASAHGVALCRGRPRFRSGSLNRLAIEQGPARACLQLARDAREGLAAELEGHFGVAVLDLSRRALVLVTDRFATHPMCWAEDPEGIAFSDRADSLAGETGFDPQPQALFHYLYFHVIPAPMTAFRGVNRMPGGHTLTATPEGVRLHRHWSPRFEEASASSFEETKRAFRDAVERAVRRECEDGAPGCYLSGGTDSSTVAGMATRVMGKSVRTFSIGFDAQGYDEMRYARLAARHFGTEHHEYYVTPRDVETGIPVLAAAYDQPFGNSSALPALYCARLCAGEGVDQLLAGDGGDELFGGNTRYAWQKVFEAYGRVPRALRAGLVEPLLLGRAVHRLPVLGKAARYVRQATTPMPERLNAYNSLVRIGVAEILTPEFLEQVDVHLPAQTEREVYQHSSAVSLVNRMLEYDWKFTLADNDLPKVCGTAAIAGVDVRFPLLGDELVDLSLRLPPEWKVKGTRLRYLFKEALRGFLPDEIIAKKKHGFGLPFGVWTVRDRSLRGLSQAALDSLARRGVLREPFARDLLARHLDAHPGYYGEIVWVLVMLEHWLAARSARAAPRPLERTAARPQ
jgi:asparagine synthase (glutamine-hydrolysing)